LQKTEKSNKYGANSLYKNENNNKYIDLENYSTPSLAKFD
jgi:hypothetical protein